MATLFCCRLSRLMSRPSTAMVRPFSISGKVMLVTSRRVPDDSSKYGSRTHSWRLSREQV
ncbi:hypothetical protein D3C75_1237300 [compost metagenome]